VRAAFTAHGDPSAVLIKVHKGITFALEVGKPPGVLLVLLELSAHLLIDKFDW